jgi:DNA-binding phage protein
MSNITAVSFEEVMAQYYAENKEEAKWVLESSYEENDPKFFGFTFGCLIAGQGGIAKVASQNNVDKELINSIIEGKSFLEKSLLKKACASIGFNINI